MGNPIPKDAGDAAGLATVLVGGRRVSLAGLGEIFRQAAEIGQAPGGLAAKEMLDALRLCNDIPAGEEMFYLDMLAGEYAAYLKRRGHR